VLAAKFAQHTTLPFALVIFLGARAATLARTQQPNSVACGGWREPMRNAVASVRRVRDHRRYDGL